MTARVLASVLVLLAGCAGSDPPSPPSDAGRGDAGSDAGHDAGPDLGVSCPSGQHACGAGCIVDQPNDPMHGCRSGCGQPCPTPPMGVASCTMAGACDFTCPSPFHRVGTDCDCTPVTCMDMGYQCGSPDNGCGVPLDCGTCPSGATCMGGMCGCMPDAHEPNDSNSVATQEPELNDADNPDETFADFDIDHATDVDWISFHVVDGFDGGNPHLYVRLYDIPVSSDYDLGVWYACDNGMDNSSCAVGTPDDMIGHGCVSRMPGIAEENVEIPSNCGGILGTANASGTVFIRVTAATFGGMCSPYSLDIRLR